MENFNTYTKKVILYKEECYLIQGAIFDVYKELGHGFLESVYQACLKSEFNRRGIPFSEQAELPIFYKGESTNLQFRADFICYGKILLEIKAVHEIIPEHRAQVLNYLKISKLQLGLLTNFGAFPRATVERVILQIS
jgi:GxxExxY protein